MNYYTIDFTNVADLSDFYQRIIKGLKFPEWCGESLDAIWDMLTGYMEAPAHITVISGNFLTDIIADKYQTLKETLDDTIEWYKDLKKQLLLFTNKKSPMTEICHRGFFNIISFDF